LIVKHPLSPNTHFNRAWLYSDYLNDLWKYDDQSWAWLGGSNFSGHYGDAEHSYAYSTKPCAAMFCGWPTARAAATTWVDPGQTVWLFGGQTASNSDSATSFLNDLWNIGLSDLQSGVSATWALGRFCMIPQGECASYNTKLTDHHGIYIPGGQSTWPGVLSSVLNV
jgi:hypothetical protein